MGFTTLKDKLVKSELTILFIALPIMTFLIGLIIPSPLANRGVQNFIEKIKDEVLVDTVNMSMPDGSIYEGSIVAGTTKREGYGKLTTIDGSVYEGEWKNDNLPWGKRTTNSSVYIGHFDRDFNNDGFGIIEYTETYIDGKREQGKADNEITRVYLGNWKNSSKHGIGRSVKVDGTMEFGEYKEGIYKKVEGANYKVGGAVYGIDVSHHQVDIDWDNLALYCDKDGNVFSHEPKEKKYMQPIFFAYIKATEGSNMKDKTYSVRAIEAERHGIVRGAYHFLHLSSSADVQVKNFLETIKWTRGNMPPALDVEVESEIREYGAKKLQDITLEWLETVENELGVRPIIYTRENIRNQYLNDQRFAKYNFWIARYSSKQPNNFDWHIWQMTDQGRINGLSGRIDINLFKSSYTDLIQYISYK